MKPFDGGLFARMFAAAAGWLIARVGGRDPDFIIGSDGNPYLLRWWIVRSRFFSVYLHRFLRDDDDRALHDHPWAWCSILLHGGYIEHTIAAGGVHHRRERHAPSVKFSLPSRAHRVELFKVQTRSSDYAPIPLPCWTLFITGPRVRQWGFHCPERGWVHWKKFTDPSDTGKIGRGCEP